MLATGWGVIGGRVIFLPCGEDGRGRRAAPGEVINRDKDPVRLSSVRVATDGFSDPVLRREPRIPDVYRPPSPYAIDVKIGDVMH
jgi:hypothetical protein